MKTTFDNQKNAMTDQAWKELILAIKPRDISVSVNNGMVTLSGTTDSYARKISAEQIVSSVTGVKSIINLIEVKLLSVDKKSDGLITDAILNAFVKNFNEPEETFAMKIENDWLTIMGEVENELGKKVAVKGYVCELVEAGSNKKNTAHPALITTKDMAYWEIFG